MASFLPTSNFMIRSNGKAYSLVMVLTYFDYAKGCIENISLDAAEAEYF